MDARGARPAQGAGPRTRPWPGVRARRAQPLGVGAARRGQFTAGLLLVVPAGRLSSNRRQAVLLPDAPHRLHRRVSAGVHLLGRTVPGAARYLRYPGRSVTADHGCAVGAGRAGRPSSGQESRVLRRYRPGLPHSRDRLDPALRAVPGLPDLRLIGGSVRTSRLERRGIAAGGACTRATTRTHPDARHRLCSDRRRRLRAAPSAVVAHRPALLGSRAYHGAAPRPTWDRPGNGDAAGPDPTRRSSSARHRLGLGGQRNRVGCGVCRSHHGGDRRRLPGRYAAGSGVLRRRSRSRTIRGWPAAEPPVAQATEHVRARPAVPAAAER